MSNGSTFNEQLLRLALDRSFIGYRADPRRRLVLRPSCQDEGVLLNALFGFVIVGEADGAATGIAFFKATILALIWIAYLSESKRVKRTYGIEPLATSIQGRVEANEVDRTASVIDKPCFGYRERCGDGREPVAWHVFLACAVTRGLSQRSEVRTG